MRETGHALGLLAYISSAVRHCVAVGRPPRSLPWANARSKRLANPNETAVSGSVWGGGRICRAAAD
jgi:hypothetical protein